MGWRLLLGLFSGAVYGQPRVNKQIIKARPLQPNARLRLGVPQGLSGGAL